MLASLIAAFASGETMRVLRQMRGKLVALALAGIAILCGLGFLVAACYIWVSRRYGDIEAAVGFGVGFLVLAGVILLVNRLTARSRARRAAKLRSSELTSIATATALAALPSLIRSRGGIGLLLGPAAAILAYAIYRENRRPDPDEDGPAGGLT